VPSSSMLLRSAAASAGAPGAVLEPLVVSAPVTGSCRKQLGAERRPVAAVVAVRQVEVPVRPVDEGDTNAGTNFVSRELHAGNSGVSAGDRVTILFALQPRGWR
jgi:hypothetical protein